MAKETEVTVTLEYTTTLNVSRYGNPRYRLHTSNGPYTTQTDAAVNYSVTNYKQGREVVLTLTANGRVVGMRYPDGTRA